ncbi:SDR family oxidoreductase [Kumtagia ephedrae]|uniref:Nucleoside-diphosphate sugar epimerase n=1 Tax=Kumtagia ephedrae TaxID=2116701 RepID=A0A2P7SLK4_9HYPH|nr:SDR family oxidoreductase [Mesorhizobium ephedrae]PSJ63231.1 nucleoside-diphosphate sugar epimerase [Mesorhizobium ephedrae]
MRVLVTGATGLIGAAVCARLIANGHDVAGMARRAAPAALGRPPVVALDMAAATRPEHWLSHLAGIDAVVNCAGILQESGAENMEAVHRDAVAALFEACARTGVRKVVHFSAIGVDREQPSSFSATKLSGDQALMALDLDWAILRPSVVLGRPAFGASALLRGLAALPVLPSMPATGRLQVVQLDDVVATVLLLLERPQPTRAVLELAGPEAYSMDEVVGLYRRWFGWREARRFVLPEWAAALLYRLGDLAAALGWRPPLRGNAAKEIRRGAVGDPSAWTALTGILPAALPAALAARPATVQEKWFARLYFVKPAIFVVLPFFWIMTGIISLSTGWRSGLELLQPTVMDAFSPAMVVAGAIADIAIGALIAWRRSARAGLYAAIALSVFYALTGTILRPDLWNEPLGPLMKILPIVVLHLVALAILEER